MTRSAHLFPSLARERGKTERLGRRLALGVDQVRAVAPAFVEARRGENAASGFYDRP